MQVYCFAQPVESRSYYVYWKLFNPAMLDWINFRPTKVIASSCSTDTQANTYTPEIIHIPPCENQLDHPQWSSCECTLAGSTASYTRVYSRHFPNLLFIFAFSALRISLETFKFCSIQWGLCALRHGIQISMEAILTCHPARSTEWLDCHPKSCELWRIRTGQAPRFTARRTLFNLVISCLIEHDIT